MSLRSKHFRQERLKRLQQAALLHIAQHGVQGLRLNTLAKELGYTSAALYRYYPSKEALVSDLQKETLLSMHQSLQRYISSAGTPSPLVGLLLCTQFYIGFAEHSPASFALNSSIFSNPTILLHGESRAQILRAMNTLLRVIHDHLVRLGLADAEDDLSRTLCLWSALHGVLLTRKYANDFSLPCPHEFVSTLLRGWGIPSSALQDAQKQLLSCSAVTDFLYLDSTERS